jgi:hypothetical protein
MTTDATFLYYYQPNNSGIRVKMSYVTFFITLFTSSLQQFSIKLQSMNFIWENQTYFKFHQTKLVYTIPSPYSVIKGTLEDIIN